jgi:ABC-2 type transport system ATP-binding protein
MSTAINLTEVTKSFQHRSWRSILFKKHIRRVEVLRNATFSVNKGEIVSLLGLNGAGKTTLIKILASLIIPDNGSATIHGYDTSTEDTMTRQLIGLVNTNNRSFYWRLSGRQNLAFFASLYDLAPRARKARINELLHWLGLEKNADMAFMKYSSGQQQRLSICRALLSEPEVLLMDEPTSSLDPIAAANLRDFVRDELVGQRNKTVLWCTHNLQEAEYISDRIVILHKGTIITQGSPKAIRKEIDNQNRYVLKIRFSGRQLPSTLQSIATENSQHEHYTSVKINTEEINIPELVSRLSDDGVEIFAVQPEERSLEYVFEELTNQHDLALNTQ